MRHIGDVAGSVSIVSGYREIGVGNRRLCLAHRLAWFYMKGEWPLHEMDHVNFDRADDRLVNLREATSAQNKGHRRAKTNSMSGVKGVYWSHPRRKWQAQLMLGKRNIYLGLFDSLWDARVAYVIAATKEFGEFATFHSRDDEVWVKERLAETMGLP